MGNANSVPTSLSSYGGSVRSSFRTNQLRIESMEMKPTSFDFRMIAHHGLMPFACASAFDFTHRLLAVGSKKVQRFSLSLNCKSAKNPF